ncbi:hypothetical protein PYCCODRAFT_1469565 [Trametes coccinea BRFM310]|uniref:Uncharacterized protein n=1 Tax=Trametes coccinea (strain BRFM310) TaxID=1353009 RepID=A0A1Y2IGJ5_TRAC3|nr:hypothetical protein PYCCODRAFT_1469565 [Trametes coccinea BRFM310]
MYASQKSMSALQVEKDGSRRGGGRGDYQQPDGWAVVGGATAARQVTKTGDLSQLNAQRQPGDHCRDYLRQIEPFRRAARAASISVLVALQRPPPPPQRRKVQLLPRSVPLENKPGSTPGTSTAALEYEGAESTNEPSMSVEEAKTWIEEDSKEFFTFATRIPTRPRCTSRSYLLSTDPS